MLGQILQPHMSRRHRRAQTRYDKSRKPIDQTPTARWPMQRRQQKHRAQHKKRHALHHAQRARVLPLNILQVVRKTQKPRANGEAGGKTLSRCEWCHGSKFTVN